ncbi:hypothetical protein Tco_0658410 [Tanacetum coccineum]
MGGSSGLLGVVCSWAARLVWDVCGRIRKFGCKRSEEEVRLSIKEGNENHDDRLDSLKRYMVWHVGQVYEVSKDEGNIDTQRCEDACQANLIKGVTVGTPVHKSNVYGIGVSPDDIEQMAQATDCSTCSMPFTYLGLPIGVNMNRLNSWQGMIDKFDKRLSKWKANLLSIGGRSTLVKAGVDKDTKKIAWVKWENILASREKGVGSINHLHDCCIVPKDTLKHKVGCGTKVRFWIDTCIGDSPLVLRYNRLYRLDVQPYCFIRDRFINREWKMQWKRPIVSGRINAMWESLQAKLQHVTPFEGQDEVRWGIGHDGKFTTSASVKSFKARVGNPINLMSDWKSWFDNLHLSSDGKSRLQVIAATVWWTIWK